METTANITVAPATEAQGRLLMTLFREMGIPYGVGKTGIPEEDRHWPVLEEKLRGARREKAEGLALRKLPSETLAGFLERTS